MNQETQKLYDNYMSLVRQEIEAENIRIAVSKELQAASNSLCFALHGVRPGSIVKTKDRVHVYKVRRIANWYGDRKRLDNKPSLDGFKQKKDGSFTTQSFSIWRDYDIVSS